MCSTHRHILGSTTPTTVVVPDHIKSQKEQKQLKGGWTQIEEENRTCLIESRKTLKVKSRTCFGHKFWFKSYVSCTCSQQIEKKQKRLKWGRTQIDEKRKSLTESHKTLKVKSRTWYGRKFWFKSQLYLFTPNRKKKKSKNDWKEDELKWNWTRKGNMFDWVSQYSDCKIKNLWSQILM